LHRLQKGKDWFNQDSTGSITGQIYRPLGRVGIYVPGGTASYPSTVLMTAIPATVAGVPEIVMVTPPGKDKSLPAATLVAAKEAGVTEIYRVGGAQAIAALAYGTASISPVDKIVGPGNIYVALAKKAVYGTVGIDMLAGPSEILIIADGSVDAKYAAADLLSQAEHDTRARAILITDNPSWASQVIDSLNIQLSQLPRRDIAALSLQQFGAVILVSDIDEAFKAANFVAPEHLELLLADPWPYLAKVEHAGAVFLGGYTPEPLGDYWAGPSHVLPTGGTARYASPLTVDDFCKRSSIIGYSYQGMNKAAKPVEYLALNEGLAAHGQAVAIREKEERP
jgi:histidinol dehydrogenase